MQSNEILAVVESVSTEKGLDESVIFEAIEIASQNKLNVCICGSLYLAGEFLKKNQTIPN